MYKLSQMEQEVLRALSEGLADYEVCARLNISADEYTESLKRIEERADAETDDAARIYEQALRRRAERLNVSLSARFHALLDIAPQAVLLVDGRTGLVKEFNEVACKLFGYEKEELSGLLVEELVPDSIRSVHHAYRRGFLTSVRKRQMGYHPPIMGKRKDGSEVEMAVALTATITDNDVLVVCTERARWIGDDEVAEAARKTTAL